MAKSSLPEYASWMGTIHRCRNPKIPAYSRYGGKGITICDEWANSFDAFLRDMGNRPAEMVLRRRDDSGPFCKENCYWGGRHEGRVSKSRTLNSAYSPWLAMRQRCMNQKATGYERYGGAGIEVCPEWDSFDRFLQDVGARSSPTHSLDRWPDPYGNYEPGNVRWATRSQQSNNCRAKKPRKQRRLQIQKESGYYGVYRNNQNSGRFGGKIWFSRLRHEFLGNFASAKEAAMAWDIAAIKSYGERAILNFPEQLSPF
jgi:hypothetical protein